MVDATKQILSELREIKLDIRLIKESMPDREMFLTTEEEKLLEESYTNEKNNKLTSSKELRKELGV